MGPSLRTRELAAWAKSRGIVDADFEQLLAVFIERDQLAALCADADQALEMFGLKPDGPNRSALRAALTQVGR